MYKIKISPYAKIFYTEWLLDPKSSRYNLVIDQTLHGNLNIEKLRNALKKYIAEHVVLNSHIEDMNNEPYWVENNSIDELEYLDHPVNAAELLDYVSQPFEIHSQPLYRFRLLKISEKAYRFILVFHHLVIDGSALSDAMVFDAIANYYHDENYLAKYSIDEQVTLITNLTDALSSKLEKNKKIYQEFWHQQLSDVDSIDLTCLNLGENHDQQEILGLCDPTREIRFHFKEKTLIKINQLKRKYAVTPYIYGQCIFALLLYRYTAQENLVISYPVTIKEGIDFIYGTQINTNLIPYRFNQTTTTIDLLNQNREFFRLTMRGNVRHGYLPIADIIQNDRKHLLNASFIQTNFRDTTFKFKGIDKVEVLTELYVDFAPKDMLLFEQELKNNKLDYRIRYNKKIFNEELLNNFVANYKKLFLEILDDLLSENSKKFISSYNLLNPKQYQKIIYDFNKTDKDYPRDKTIHQLFEEQVLKTPDHIAVVYKNTRLTYQELNKKANQLANYLLDNYAIRPDDLIALCLDRSEQMLIAILGVLKSGAAYVPIDPDYPEARINYILEDTQTKIIITNVAHENRIQKLIRKNTRNTDALAIDSKATQAKLAKQKNTIPVTSITSSNLIYVIYTSGTTGNSKGVMIEHRNVVNYILSILPKYAHIERVDFSGSLAFDLTVTTTIFPMVTGKTIFIYHGNLSEIQSYIEHININNIEFIKSTPSFLSNLPNQLIAKRMKICMVGGEKLATKTAEHTLEFAEQIVDEYGPTETTVGTTENSISRKSSYYSIGKPYTNCKVYVLDNNLKPLPIAAVGEIYIGGNGVARGYLNDPGLTAKKFRFNPFQTNQEKAKNINGRLYKTGDLARWLPDGNLEYIGRRDSQVKIRGYRIELGEIENKLIAHPSVKQAAVLAKKNLADSRYLIAYYVADHKINEEQLKNYLATQLPQYMLPAFFIHIDQLPLTVNGKLDRKALPEFKFENSKNYVAPSNEPEELICKAFAEILGIEKIGVNDDFFALGGNSIKAIQLIVLLQTNFDVKVTNIFKLRSPKKLAEHAYFGKNVLRQRLEQIKLLYDKNKKHPIDIDNRQQKKVNLYLKNSGNLQQGCFLTNPITHVLLTGSTGYLGCNILNQLLTLTNYNVFLLVRANSQKEAMDRVNKKFHFYFDKTLDYFFNSRIFVMKADIERGDLGLSLKEHKILVAKTDSIIHAAALIKHYGEYDKFYSANVQATINLLDLAKSTKLKDFHYISTRSVLDCAFVPNCEEYTYTEDDLPNNLKLWNNVYIQTKLQGEQYVVKYRNHGVNGSIYRVGNLAFMAENYRTQENIDDSAFFNWLKCLLKIQCVVQNMSVIEISQADMTAQAIVKLFDKKQLANGIYHVFNPYLFNMAPILANNGISLVSVLTMKQFIDNIIRNLSNKIYHDLIVKFLLHQGWLNEDEWGTKDTISITVLQNKTQSILKQLGFEWTPITNESFNQYLKAYNTKKLDK